MPGSDLFYSTNPESFDMRPASVTQKAPSEMPPQITNTPVGLLNYKTQNFNDVKKHEMFGPRISRREQRKFHKYLFSPQGMQEAADFYQTEQQKAKAASDYAASKNTPILKAAMPSMVSDTQKQAALDAISQPMKAPIPKPEVKAEPKPVNTAYWNSQANKFGFNNMDEVKAWQQQNGLVADGMFGKNSEAKWRSMQQQASTPKLVSRTITAVDGTPVDIVRRSSSVPKSSELVVPAENENTASSPEPKTQAVTYPYYRYTMPTYRNFYKKGGPVNRINYFQQGGAAPQQDIKAQVTALVQAAMQGDQKATQQVNQIMEAAKSGDQQAMQIAQIVEQVVKELQGQATSAKWGAKLGYLKSLKYAKGGKTCPACEKKVEMKACGGKKAKKRYFGGLV